MICTKCGREFTIPFGEQPYKTCRQCREYNRMQMKGLLRKTAAIKPKDNLARFMEKVEEYNSRYGTHYSYGQYLAAKENGWLQCDWSEFEDDNG